MEYRNKNFHNILTYEPFLLYMSKKITWCIFAIIIHLLCCIITISILHFYGN